jgi:hypothetical protein
MMYCVYVDNELEESDLTKEEALELEGEILEDCPEAEIRMAPMNEDMEELEDEDEEDFEDDTDVEEEE